MERPAVPPPSTRFVRERREAYSAPRPQQMEREPGEHAPILRIALEDYYAIWPKEKDPHKQPARQQGELPSAEEFFAPGQLNPCCNPRCPVPGGLKNWWYFCGDVKRIFSSPQPLCLPCQNGVAWCMYNFCAGAASGLFIWPRWCPCGLATCCYYGPELGTKPWDFFCCCCKEPSDRCDSLLFIAQRFTIAGSNEYRTLWPTPPGLGFGQVTTEKESYVDTNPNKYTSPNENSHPNRFVSFFESLGDLGLSIPCAFWCCVGYNQCCLYPGTTWMPASRAVGYGDKQMDVAKEFGGVWVFPSSIGKGRATGCCDLWGCVTQQVPTPPNARDAQGNPLPTNVKPGEPGSRVIFWAHGSGYAITSTLHFLYVIGFFLAKSTGNVILLAEYPLTSGGEVFPTQIDLWTRDYLMLCELYGPENVIVAGDSAGANLAMGMVINATSHIDKPLPPPAGTLLLSPWADMANSFFVYRNKEVGDSVNENNPYGGGILNYGTGSNGRDYIPLGPTMMVSASYASAAWRATSFISPIMISRTERRALQGMKAFISYGTNEVFRSTTEGFALKLQGRKGWFTEGEYADPEDATEESPSASDDVAAGHGIDVTTQELQGMPHDVPVIAPALVYNLGFCCGKGDPSKFEPTHAWVEIFDWIASIPGFEGAKPPSGW